MNLTDYPYNIITEDWTDAKHNFLKIFGPMQTHGFEYFYGDAAVVWFSKDDPYYVWNISFKNEEDLFLYLLSV